jgi:hypothetical protein
LIPKEKKSRSRGGGRRSRSKRRRRRRRKKKRGLRRATHYTILYTYNDSKEKER